MDNVIRPSFGGRQQPASTEPPAYEDGYQPLHVYGRAAGHLVALIEDASGPEGLVLKVVVGPAAGNSIEAVACDCDALHQDGRPVSFIPCQTKLLRLVRCRKA